MAFLFLAAAAHAGAGQKDSLGTLETLVDRWVTLRETLASERRAWKEQREQWEREIYLLEQEEETLRKKIGTGSEEVSVLDARRREALARKEGMQEERARLAGVLDRAEADLKAWETRIPEGLKSPLQETFRGLPATKEEAGGLSIIQRARNVVTLYTRIEMLLNGIHAVRETLDMDGAGRRHVEVLYVGLARGFAVSPGNDWSAVGTPSPDGWTWTPGGDASAIRRALQIWHRRDPAQLVWLPMQFAGEEGP